MRCIVYVYRSNSLFATFSHKDCSNDVGWCVCVCLCGGSKGTTEWKTDALFNGWDASHWLSFHSFAENEALVKSHANSFSLALRKLKVFAMQHSERIIVSFWYYFSDRISAVLPFSNISFQSECQRRVCIWTELDESLKWQSHWKQKTRQRWWMCASKRERAKNVTDAGFHIATNALNRPNHIKCQNNYNFHRKNNKREWNSYYPPFFRSSHWWKWFLNANSRNPHLIHCHDLSYIKRHSFSIAIIRC